MTKHLKRSSDDRMIAGVCGGLADYIGADPAIVRLAVVALTFLGVGTTIVVYLVAWIIVPMDDDLLTNRDEPRPPLS